jgi:hypothetical protein
VSPRYHISEDDLRRLREKLAEARIVQEQHLDSIRLMDRLIRMASERRI